MYNMVWTKNQEEGIYSAGYLKRKVRHQGGEKLKTGTEPQPPLTERASHP
jgi:hypothetical protein